MFTFLLSTAEAWQCLDIWLKKNWQCCRTFCMPTAVARWVQKRNRFTLVEKKTKTKKKTKNSHCRLVVTVYTKSRQSLFFIPSLPGVSRHYSNTQVLQLTRFVWWIPTFPCHQIIYISISHPFQVFFFWVLFCFVFFLLFFLHIHVCNIETSWKEKEKEKNSLEKFEERKEKKKKRKERKKEKRTEMQLIPPSQYVMFFLSLSCSLFKHQ